MNMDCEKNRISSHVTDLHLTYKIMATKTIIITGWIMLVAVLGSSFVHKQQRRRSYKDNNKKERMAITAPTTTLFSHKSHPYYHDKN